ncbi:hypothetical protein V1477_001098 [Vespula maculifrons]|uniref:Uncharacterized protein n=1 Tax=Vespula maculifrons TaxID=7453 RepID=A0ABD2D0T6_VESMC
MFAPVNRKRGSRSRSFLGRTELLQFKQAEQAVDWSVNFEERVNFSQVTPQKPDSRSSSIIGPKTIRFLGRKYESKRDKDRDRARECEVVQRIRSMIGW